MILTHRGGTVYQQRHSTTPAGPMVPTVDEMARAIQAGEPVSYRAAPGDLDDLTFLGYPPAEPDYCTQNAGDCLTCALSSYGRDCKNIKID
jgi:hypothetical protein